MIGTGGRHHFGMRGRLASESAIYERCGIGGSEGEQQVAALEEGDIVVAIKRRQPESEIGDPAGFARSEVETVTGIRWRVGESASTAGPAKPISHVDAKAGVRAAEDAAAKTGSDGLRSASGTGIQIFNADRKKPDVEFCRPGISDSSETVKGIAACDPAEIPARSAAPSMAALKIVLESCPVRVDRARTAGAKRKP